MNTKKHYIVRNSFNFYNYGDFEYKDDAEKMVNKFNEDSLKEDNIAPFYVEEIEIKENEVEDVMLAKHGYNDDYLSWTYKGKEYWAQGEFYVDDCGVLHHTFITPEGKEIEIACDYD